MAWVVDTCVLIDVAEADPTFGVASAKLLDSKRADRLTICPVTSGKCFHAWLSSFPDRVAAAQNSNEVGGNLPFSRDLSLLYPLWPLSWLGGQKFSNDRRHHWKN